MLAVSDLEVFYGESRALNRVTMAIGEGQVVCVMGRNGVGKTTLLKTIVGLLTPRRGRVEFAGREVTALAPYERARLGIAYVPQGREIFPLLTVRENLTLAVLPALTRLGVVSRARQTEVVERFMARLRIRAAVLWARRAGMPPARC